MESLFCCPLCGGQLTYDEQSCLCPEGHCFDRGAAGYTHLLPANKKHSKNPGDDKAMVAARSAFLEKGHYSPLREALCRMLLDHLAPEAKAPVLLDSGCGEGWYTAGLYEALTRAGLSPRVAGVDLSKFALKRAAKRLHEGEFAVASVYHLPLADQSIDVLTNVFSPLALEEFSRVLKPSGFFLYVVPSALHLWEMKELLYEHPYENAVKLDTYTGFSYQCSQEVRYALHLEDPADIMALFGMTPYAWKTPEKGVQRLRACSSLNTQIGFDIHLYRKD